MFVHSCQYFICHDKEIRRIADGQIPPTHHESSLSNMHIIDITEREKIKREFDIGV
jgi:hypothetical protein